MSDLFKMVLKPTDIEQASETSTSHSKALDIDRVIRQSEQFYCEENGNENGVCLQQCFKCKEIEGL